MTTTIYFIKATNKVNNEVIGYLTDEVYDGVKFGSVDDVVANEYYWKYNNHAGVEGAMNTAKYWEKKFPAIHFSVEHLDVNLAA